MRQSILKILTNDGIMIEIESKYLINDTENEMPIIKIREDLIDVYDDDMDYREKFYLRREFLDIRRHRWDEEVLWRYILDKNYTKQLEFLSEMFIQYISDKDFYEWIAYINNREKFDKFFSIFRNKNIRLVNNIHGVIVNVFDEEMGWM